MIKADYKTLLFIVRILVVRVYTFYKIPIIIRAKLHTLARESRSMHETYVTNTTVAPSARYTESKNVSLPIDGIIEVNADIFSIAQNIFSPSVLYFTSVITFSFTLYILSLCIVKA